MFVRRNRKIHSPFDLDHGKPDRTSNTVALKQQRGFPHVPAQDPCISGRDFSARSRAGARAAGSAGENEKAMQAMPGGTMGMMGQPASLPDRLAAREKGLAAQLEATRKLKAAVDPLYAALSDEQKKTADELTGRGGMMGAGGMMGMMGAGMQPGGMQDQGMMGGDQRGGMHGQPMRGNAPGRH